jgi:hypothetical protein
LPLGSVEPDSEPIDLCLGGILSQQAIGVLVRATLPGTVRIAEVHRDVGGHREALVVGEFGASDPGQRFVEFLGQPAGLLDPRLDERVRVTAGILASIT